MDLQNMTLEDALAQICILAEHAESLVGEYDQLSYKLEQMKDGARDWLGEVLARKRTSDLRDSMRAKPPARKPKPAPPPAVIPPAVDDMVEALREPLADAIEADIEAEKPGTVAESAAGLHQQTMRPEMVALGSIKDPGKFAALVSAGWSKKDLAQEFKCDVRAVEEYCRVMRLKLHPGKRRSTVRVLENRNGEAM